MKHTRSSAEVEIRDAVVAWCRRALPGYRVVHELNTGGTGSERADVAAVGLEDLVLFEIKSERDTLKRLADQLEAYRRVSHETIVVAHRRWFEDITHPGDVPNAGRRFLRPCEALTGLRLGLHLWAYPEPGAEFTRYSGFRWERGVRWSRGRQPQPRAWDLLHMLWRDELAVEAGLHGIGANGRSTIDYLAGEMAWLMSGREIARAVCRRLRARKFAEADPPVLEEVGAR